MAMKRTKTPWMAADAFGRSLPLGLGVNLLVPEIAPMEAFCRDVIGACVVYADEDFAAVTLFGTVFMLHADHSYSDNPMSGIIRDAELRGAGIELRLYGVDPDVAEECAILHGHHVLAGSIDKPHGLRECHLIGPNGYVFVPSKAIGS